MILNLGNTHPLKYPNCFFKIFETTDNWLWLEKHKALFLKTFDKQIYKNIFSAFSNSNKWNIVIATLLDKFMV